MGRDVEYKIYLLTQRHIAHSTHKYYLHTQRTFFQDVVYNFLFPYPAYPCQSLATSYYWGMVEDSHYAVIASYLSPPLLRCWVLPSWRLQESRRHRAVSWMCNVSNVSDAAPPSRWPDLTSPPSATPSQNWTSEYMYLQLVIFVTHTCNDEVYAN